MVFSLLLSTACTESRPFPHHPAVKWLRGAQRAGRRQSQDSWPQVTPGIAHPIWHHAQYIDMGEGWCVLLLRNRLSSALLVMSNWGFLHHLSFWGSISLSFIIFFPLQILIILFWLLNCTYFKPRESGCVGQLLAGVNHNVQQLIPSHYPLSLSQSSLLLSQFHPYLLLAIFLPVTSWTWANFSNWSYAGLVQDHYFWIHPNAAYILVYSPTSSYQPSNHIIWQHISDSCYSLFLPKTSTCRRWRVQCAVSDSFCCPFLWIWGS